MCGLIGIKGEGDSLSNGCSLSRGGRRGRSLATPSLTVE